jgi:hypothetical protein
MRLYECRPEQVPSARTRCGRISKPLQKESASGFIGCDRTSFRTKSRDQKTCGYKIGTALVGSQIGGDHR